MTKILDYIESSGKGKYVCYKTKKGVFNTDDYDILTYDDKPISQSKNSKFAESDQSRIPVERIDKDLIRTVQPIFSYFLDGSRHVYKVDDIAIGKRIFPFLAGQTIVGCCHRKDRDSFKGYKLYRKLVLSLPDNFDLDDGGDNFRRLYCEKLNEAIKFNRYVVQSNLKVDDILLYKTDGISGKEDKGNYINRAIAIIQNSMTDDEQLLVAELCRENRLDDENFLIKDGSIEYNPEFSLLDKSEWNLLRSNYKHVVGVSKKFDPELIPDFTGNKLSKTIAQLKPFERTKVYRYESGHSGGQFAVWYLRLRNSEFRETHFSDVVKCEMVITKEGDNIDTNIINTISANLIRESYPVCYGTDARWANHLYPVFLTETFCKAHYIDSNIILNLF